MVKPRSSCFHRLRSVLCTKLGGSAHRPSHSSLVPMKSPPVPGSFESASPEFEDFLKRCNEQQLLAQLRALQILLGTPAERPDDVVNARAVAHRLNNLATASQLMSQLKKLDEGARTAPGSMKGC